MKVYEAVKICYGLFKKPTSVICWSQTENQTETSSSTHVRKETSNITLLAIYDVKFQNWQEHAIKILFLIKLSLHNQNYKNTQKAQNAKRLWI